MPRTGVVPGTPMGWENLRKVMAVGPLSPPVKMIERHYSCLNNFYIERELPVENSDTEMMPVAVGTIPV